MVGITSLVMISLAVGGFAARDKSQPSFLFILGDDIGWADFSYNNGTANSPRIKEWTETQGTLIMQDFHSGGTVCSPTRATVLTGRNHFRDCVDYVYGCSDMTECVPHFNFAPQRTFTAPDAARAANKNYTSWFGGKWHLGSFYNDSEKYGGITSSPISHGFDHMNATVEVAPTATLNCECTEEWYPSCNFGHYGKPGHCGGHGNPGGGPPLKPGCCFNYWWDDKDADHGVTNLTNPSPDDDSTYLAGAFVKFVEDLDGAPFMAQISFHNCHIPFIGTQDQRKVCNDSKTCKSPLKGAEPYSFEELDFYACLNEFDGSVGTVLDALKRLGYYENTMIWFTTDNGPEVNCAPEGRCGSGSTGVIPPGTLHRPDCGGAGSAGPLRGRKRDVWEGGHRVPGIISWPAMVQGPPRQVWDTVVTMDFLATMMEVLDVERPKDQQDWHFDGVSVLPILKGETPPVRGIGWMYMHPNPTAKYGYGYRYGKWKLSVGGISCHAEDATFNCSKPQLYDLESDIGENFDLATKYPDVLTAIMANFSAWQKTIIESMANESKCEGMAPTGKFPEHPTPSDACEFIPDHSLTASDFAHGTVSTKEECCGACLETEGCMGSDFVAASPMRPTADGQMTGGECHLKTSFVPGKENPGETQTAIKPNKVVALR